MRDLVGVIVIGVMRIGLRKEELEQRREAWLSRVLGRRRGRIVVGEEEEWEWGLMVVVIEEIRPATDMALGFREEERGFGWRRLEEIT